MFAIIEAGGKQFRVQNGDVVFVDKLNAEVDSEVSFDVLMAEIDGKVLVGAPKLEIKAQGKVLGQVKGQKLLVFKYKSKKNERKRRGHRQPYTKVQITTIG